MTDDTTITDSEFYNEIRRLEAHIAAISDVVIKAGIATEDQLAHLFCQHIERLELRFSHRNADPIY